MADPAPEGLPDGWDGPERLATADRMVAEALIVDVDGFEGPLDMLLALSRTQKVDLRKISILKLAEQYLDFVEQARLLRIELAADYLVMAAWLAFLKSRLLLPPEPGDDGPTAEELAEHLAFQLERLAAMRDAAAQLLGRDQLGRQFFARGLAADLTRSRQVRHTATLLDLMRAYARIRTRDDFRPFVLDRDHVYTMEQALDRMRGLIGSAIDWADLTSFLPEGWSVTPMARRSATAAHFAAVLELAKLGKVTLRQGDTFAPIQLRRRDP